MYDGLHFELDEKKYQLGKTLGTGSYGVVVKALDRTTRQNVAVKQIPNLYEEHDATKKTMREIRVLQSLRACDYIMTLLDVELSGTSIYIITELCDTDLCTLIQNDNLMAKLKPQKYLTIMWELLYAVGFMHSIDILHRDIKPSNILLDSNFTVKLCDFGLARVSHNSETFSDPAAKEMTEYVVSRWYRAPEVVLVPGRYGKKQDVWSCACSMAELVIRKPLFPGTSVVNQVHVIIDILGKPRPDDINFQMSDRSHRYMSSIQSAQTGLDTVLKAPSDTVSSNLYSLLESMLLFDPRRRPACIDAMRHEVFSSLHQRQQNIAELTKDIKIDLDSIDQCNCEATSLVNMMGSVVLDVRQHLKRLRSVQAAVHGDSAPADNQARRLTVGEMGSIMAAAVMSGVAAEVDPLTRTVTTVTMLRPVEAPPAVATVNLPQRPGIVQRVIQRRRSVMVSREDFSADEPGTTTAVAPTKELKKINKSFSKDCLTIDFKKQNFNAPSFNPPAFKPPPSLHPHPPESLAALKKSVRPHPTKVSNRKPTAHATTNPARPVSKSVSAQSSKTPPPRTPPPRTPPPKTPPPKTPPPKAPPPSEGPATTTTPKKDGPRTTPKSALWRKASQIPSVVSSGSNSGSSSKVFNNPKTPTMATDSSKASLHESDSRAHLKKKP